jgi:putative oxidoreductase
VAGAKPGGTTDLGKFILRVVVGIGIMTHGYPKVFGVTAAGAPRMERFIQGVAGMGFPYPMYFAWAAALSELVGGLLLVLGLGARAAGFLVASTMAVALYRHRTDSFGDMEMALLYFAAALFFVLSGPGRYSLDALLFKRK